MSVLVSAGSAEAALSTTYVAGFAQLLSPLPPAVPVVLPGPNANALQGQTAWAQVAAYEQYLLYLSLVSSQPSAAPDVGQYFRNGAAVTGVPAAGQPGSSYFSNGAAVTSVPHAGQPGSSYFSNGAAVTSVPSGSQPGSGYFTNGAEATRFPLTVPTVPPPPPQAPRQPAPSSRTAESAAPTIPPAVPALTPAARSAPEVWVEGPPMSFKEWLQSMGGAPESEAPTGPLAAASISTEETSVEEPYATAEGLQQRAHFALPERPREPVAASAAARRLFGPMLGAFALGLLLSALVMLRMRPRVQRPARAPSGR
jgi:hypothetical protein